MAKVTPKQPQRPGPEPSPARSVAGRVEPVGNQPGKTENHDQIAEHLYAARSLSKVGQLVDFSGVSDRDVQQITDLMKALANLRNAEQVLAEASKKYMKLSSLAMRALHYLIAAKSQEVMVTPSMLAAHLDISAASTTKLLNRLERGKHITRSIHPADRRAFAIDVTDATKASAMETVGRQQARRFYSAARLSEEQRQTVTKFLNDMSDELSLAGADWAEQP